VFAVVFVLMTGFVIVITMSAAKSRGHALAGASGSSSRTVAAGMAGSPGAPPAGSAAVQQAGQSGTGHVASTSAISAHLDARLAAALQPAIRNHRGQLAVGVIDKNTGAEALYDASKHFHTASIVKADILATLLLQHQQAGTQLSGQDAELAATMIENSDDTAASELWNVVGGAGGVRAADMVLRLDHTSPGKAGYWGLTRTTVADQLQLLTDLTSATSPLDAAGRDYELGLMANVETDQRWGVPAAASPGTSYAVKDGWLPDPRLWVINSIGIIEHDGQELLIVVLSKGNPTEASGQSLAQAAAVAAANVVTHAAS
jgi:Beta-lactamase enzyme family